MNSVIRHLRRAVLLPDGNDRTDGQLLESFVARHEEAAFEALVRRHGPMVLGVCRRVLRNHHDADDAFQATFLVLARKAASLRQRELVGNWLYGVAYRTALEAKAVNARRWAKERQVMPMPEPAAPQPRVDADWHALLDQELNRLPDKYRVPVVLCDLEGRSRKDVAQLLHIPEGTLSSRLATARKTLARRLTRHGITLAGGALAVFLSRSAVAAVPGSLVAATVKAATGGVMGGAAAAVVSAKVAALTEGVLKTMLWTKLKLTAVLLAVAGMIGLGAGLLVQGALADKPAISQKAPPKADAKPKAAPKTDHDQLLGVWKVTAALFNGQNLPDTDTLVKDGRMYFQKDVIYTKLGEKIEGPVGYEIDGTQNPKTIDLMDDRSQPPVKGIYRLNGDDLQLCFAQNHEAERPTEFASKADSKVTLMTFKRDPKAPKLDLKKAEAQRQARVDRLASARNLAKITMAMFDYHDAQGTLPPVALADEKGKPLLSWRVAILPYLGEQNLYNQFKVDEPWDSDHNKKLLAQMPAVYGADGTETHYQVFTGLSTVFEAGKGIKFEDITHGRERTALVAEAAKAVPWTKPADLEYNPAKPLPKLGGGLFKEGFHLATADGVVRFVRNKFNEKVLHALIIRTSMEAIDPNDLSR
jgi:RNA polymerase sigma-70 factor (ECF subfamily)